MARGDGDDVAAVKGNGLGVSFGVLFLAAWTGFVSLSYELLWTRIFSFMTMGRSFAFPMCLGLFLLGIAIGARVSKRYSQRYASGSKEQLGVLAAFMIGASIYGYLTIPLMRMASVYVTVVDSVLSLYIICAGAVLFGAQFPLLAHFGVEADARSGVKVSYIYVANIVGSVAGSLLTGFYLLDQFSLASLTMGLAMVGTVMGCVVLVMALEQSKRRALVALLGVVLCVGVVASRGVLFDSLYRDLLRSTNDEVTTDVKYVIESKSGVVVVNQDDQVFGGGVYDGKFATDFVHDTNFVIRPFSLGAFHPDPKKLLFIGLGSGSWARVVASHPDAEQITIVEISGDYVKLADHYPGFERLLADDRVKVITDDGRRWLQSTDETFDVVVSNTTFHWRSMASNLLSKEFFELIKAHLNPGGVVMYNTTGSVHAIATGLSVFDDAYLVFNTVVASPQKMPYDPQRLRKVLLDYRIDGEPILDSDDPEDMKYLEETLTSFEKTSDEQDLLVRDRAMLEQLVAQRGGGVITDYNMRGEWDVADLFMQFLLGGGEEQ